MIYALYLAAFLVFVLVVTPALLVAIGLFFKKDLGLRVFTDGTPVNNYELPNWLKWMQNPEDNLTGDKRGWYWNIKMAGKSDWFKMWWWSGVRNTYNYFKRITIGCDVRKHVITKVCGQDYVRDDFNSTGFQILIARGEGLPKPALYWVRRWGKTNRAIVVQLGWKIKLSHNGVIYEDDLDYYKGMTAEPNPFKDIS